jgi:hypothetical protein
MPLPPTLRMALAAGFLGLAAAGCVAVSTGTGDAGPAPSGTTPVGGGGGIEGGTTGTGCGPDPTTGAVLCLGVTACPSLAIDPSAWPSCGFRVAGGTTLDLECICGDSLCPIGVATSCEQATTLLSSQTQLMVCEQVAEQRCLTVTPPATTPSGSGGPDAGVPSTCNQTCLVGCGTAADCLQLCGC